jgi:hypothetical protein
MGEIIGRAELEATILRLTVSASLRAFSRRNFARIRSPWSPQSRNSSGTLSLIALAPAFSANRFVW